MTKEERLSYCSLCRNKIIDFDRGLLCSLTGKIPTFEDECENLLIDTEEQDRREQLKKEIKKDYQKKELYSDVLFCLIFSVFSIRNGFLVFMITLSVVAFCILVSNLALIRYEKKSGKELNNNVKALIKYVFAILVFVLIGIPL